MNIGFVYTAVIFYCKLPADLKEKDQAPTHSDTTPTPTPTHGLVGFLYMQTAILTGQWQPKESFLTLISYEFTSLARLSGRDTVQGRF